MSTPLTCCFTGHRTLNLRTLPQLKQALSKSIEQLILAGYTSFGSGGALGFDLLAAEAVIKLKETYPDISLFLALPCRNQTKFWSEEQQKAYQRILSCSDEIVYTAEHYYTGCMHVRNRYLISRATCFLAYLTQETGGTKYTVSEAEKAGKPVLYITDDPVIEPPPLQLSLL
ncbi:MAG: DUF1273 family protein [Clostridia bacterium]|nr:DUF1273 family protein [Clostridia bacterium]